MTDIDHIIDAAARTIALTPDGSEFEWARLDRDMRRMSATDQLLVAHAYQLLKGHPTCSPRFRKRLLELATSMGATVKDLIVNGRNITVLHPPSKY